MLAQAGLMQGAGGIHTQSQTPLSTLLNIKAQVNGPWGDDSRAPGEEEEGQGEYHTAEAHLHRKGSILISREEQGMVSSNLVMTSG